MEEKKGRIGLDHPSLSSFVQARKVFHAGQFLYDRIYVFLLYSVNFALAAKVAVNPELVYPFLLAHFTNPGFYMLLFLGIACKYAQWKQWYLRNR